MALITYTALSPLVGGLIDRFGPRRIVIPGILILALGLGLCSAIETLGQFYLFYGVVMGSGITVIGIITYSSVLAHWFEKKRGLASGLAVSGMGLGTFLLVPLSQNFISMWGWQVTFIATAILVLVILLPINGLLLRHKPEDVGQHPDGLIQTEASDAPASTGTPDKARGIEDWTIKQAVRSGRFWALIIFPFLSIIGIYIVLVHNVRFLVDQGVDKMSAAFIFAMVGVISSIFRIFWGWLSDRIGREITFTMGMVCACLGVGSLLFFENSGSKLFTYSFFLFFGMGWGVAAPMYMSVAADLFRGKIFGLIYGFLEAGVGLAGALGAWLAGYIFDQTGSYQKAFILTIIVFLLSCLFVWLAAPRKFRR
jgi:MFS family permease